MKKFDQNALLKLIAFVFVWLLLASIFSGVMPAVATIYNEDSNRYIEGINVTVNTTNAFNRSYVGVPLIFLINNTLNTSAQSFIVSNQSELTTNVTGPLSNSSWFLVNVTIAGTYWIKVTNEMNESEYVNFTVEYYSKGAWIDLDGNGTHDIGEPFWEKIQDAINNATDGDTIIVHDGTYTENVDVNKSMTIRSENGSAPTTVQTSNPNDHVFNVTADYVNISGFTVTGTTDWPSAGIYLDNANHCNISNTHASNNNRGIHLSSSSCNKLTNNTANSNTVYGIYLSSSSNNTLMNNTANSNNNCGIHMSSSSCNKLTNNTANSNIVYGIYLSTSSNNTLTNNTANSNYGGYYDGNGIYLWSSSNNTLTNNTANSNNNFGICLSFSNCNNLASNTARSNNNYGIYLLRSSNNTLTKNMMSENNNNFGVLSYTLSDYIHNIDTTNKVNEKTVYYWINQQNRQIPNDAGYVGVVNSTNITVKDLTLTNNGIQFAYTRHSRIENVNVSNSNYGIYLLSSSSNNLINNTVSNNNHGIYLSSLCNNNTIAGNDVSNTWFGIYLSSSNNNLITGNDARNNSCSIYLDYSNNNTIAGNDASNNNYGGIYLGYSNNNLLTGNDASNSSCSIDLFYSNNNTIAGNDVSNNRDGIYVSSSCNNNLTNNTVSNNNHGIYLDIWYSPCGFVDATSNNIITRNTVTNNIYGIYLGADYIPGNLCSKNTIYLNNFINSTYNARSYGNNNTWDSLEPITYTYNGSEYVNELGNFWSDYSGSDENADGIGDIPYIMYGVADNYPLMQPFEVYFQTPSSTEVIMNETTSSTHTLFETIISQNATLNTSVTGDFNGTLNFTNLEIVHINSGSFDGKGFSKGNWSANIEGNSYEGHWQGMLFKKPEERKIYLKGKVSGGLKGLVEGHLTESINGSAIYDQYQATWTINHIGNDIVFATLDLNGTVNYQEGVEYSSELYALQTSIEGESSGYYNGSLNVVLTHVRIDNETNSYYGQGFSIISYVSEFGSGEGWAYNRPISPNISQLNGLFTDPLTGILSGTLDESTSPRTLSISIERIDIGLPPMADLKVRVWGPGSISPWETVDYIIEYRNDGLKEADEVLVFNVLDSSLEFVSASSKANYDEFFNTVSWNLGEAPSKFAGFLNARVRIPWGLSHGTALGTSTYIINIEGSSGSPNLFVNGINLRFGSDSAIKYEEFARHREAGWVPTYYTGYAVVPPPGFTSDVMHVDYATPPTITPTDYNGLTNPLITNHDYDTCYAYSGGTRTVVTAIGYYNLKCKKVILISPMSGVYDAYKSELEDLLQNKGVEEIEIYQSPQDNLFLGSLYQAKFDPDDPWLEGKNIKVHSINVPGSNGPAAHWNLFLYVNYILKYNIGDPREGLSSSTSTITTAHDPNIKYGPEGFVLPGQKLNYTVEYENEGEGIAFGVYFVDTLDEDLDDSTLEIGPVLSTINGSVIALAGIYDPETRTITWFVGEVGPGEGGYANVSTDVRSDAEETEIINYATVYFPSVPEETRTNGIVSIVDTAPPRCSNVGQNKYEVSAGESVKVYAYWQDGVQLNHTWLETNESGTWENVSYLKLWNEGWSNFTIQTNQEGLICWRIHANDTAGNENVTQMLCFDVLPAPLPPIALFNYTPLTPVIGELITFNASQSYDPDGFITKYEWNFGDGNITNTTEEIITHSYSLAGNYTVNLTVTDNGGAINLTSKVVPVQAVDTTPPVITNVTVINITINSAVIAWNTNEPSDSLVKYGTESGNYTLQKYDSKTVTLHRVNLIGLLPNTTYYFAVSSTDQSDNSNDSMEYSFITLVTAEVIPANVVIKPESLNLKSKGVFSAFIQLSEGYDVADINVSTVVCEGAQAIRGVVDGDMFIAKFNRQDLIDVPTGDAVELTVTGELYNSTPFEGSDIIRVIEKGGKK
jgi:parallel beta-helix repeat protein